MKRLRRVALALKRLCEGSIDGPDPFIEPSPLPAGQSRLVFTGTGNSTGTPRPACLLSMQDDPDSRVSLLAMRGSPKNNRNYRGNPGMLIQYAAADGGISNIQIDVGKTYRESLLRWYPVYRVPWIDAVILTHDHADAILGCDDLRTVQKASKPVDQTSAASRMAGASVLPVFVSPRHMPVLRSVFPYLMPKEEKSSTNGVVRFVAKLDWKEVADFETFACPGGLEVTTLPVLHGKDYICQAFAFGRKDRVAYLSDVSAVPPETLAFLEREPIHLLILDTLYETSHATHFGLQDALTLIRRLRPQRALLVGISDAFEHHATNLRLSALRKSEGLDVQLAYDGQYVDVDL
mmetsp:Transcript_37640/g.70356  ORF Transcript_37640/g.70356 Transcript_37640/m.70356 type:complete len:349 (+) Transcript_37640:34-1080(+)